MIPWGWDTSLIPDYNDLYTVSKIGADALKSVNGAEYLIGSPANLLCNIKKFIVEKNFKLKSRYGFWRQF